MSRAPVQATRMYQDVRSFPLLYICPSSNETDLPPSVLLVALDTTYIDRWRSIRSADCAFAQLSAIESGQYVRVDNYDAYFNDLSRNRIGSTLFH